MTKQEITARAIQYSFENGFENATCGEIMRAFEDGALWMKEEMETKKTLNDGFYVHCKQCNIVFKFNNDSIIDGSYVKCPDCGEIIQILS